MTLRLRESNQHKRRNYSSPLTPTCDRDNEARERCPPGWWVHSAPPALHEKLEGVLRFAFFAQNFLPCVFSYLFFFRFYPSLRCFPPFLDLCLLTPPPHLSSSPSLLTSRLKLHLSLTLTPSNTPPPSLGPVRTHPATRDSCGDFGDFTDEKLEREGRVR